ncbi:MAG TPA: hypothetical protein VK619_18840 [Pyrinomonadaceae bacterium]|nr:hypothetical protein [Pyrinomonadaceae bacterium]
MEREKEISKLVNVLRRTGRMAFHANWVGDQKDTASFCVERYNRVLARLKEIDEAIASVFDPLPAESSLTVVGMACKQLSAYYEDEVEPSQRHRHGRAFGIALDPQAFKEFWRTQGREIEDLGEFIRESINEWVRTRKSKSEGCAKPQDQHNA